MPIAGDVYSDLYEDLYPGIETPPRRKKTRLPEIAWLMDDKHVPVREDWRATSTVNGGYDTASLTVPADFDRQFPSLFDVGAKTRAFDHANQLIWEGDITSAPTSVGGAIEVVARGGFMDAEQRDENLLYQDRRLTEWQDENGAPYNGSGDESIRVATDEGMLSLTAEVDTEVFNGDQHDLARWAPGSKIRQLRFLIITTGDLDGYELVVSKATGPNGARTEIDAFGLDGLPPNFDLIVTAPTDMILVGLRRFGLAHTRADTLTVVMRDARINDLTLTDSFDLSNIIADIGQRLRYDTSGLSLGIPISHLSPAVQRIRSTPIIAPPHSPFDPRMDAQRTTFGNQEVISETAKVNTSPLNFLPFYHEGRWADALHLLCQAIDWRWRVLGDLYGNGRVLEAGPFGPHHTIGEGEGEGSQLRRIPPHNRFNVRWTDTSGRRRSTVVHADPDPYESRAIVRMPPALMLSDPQPDDTIPQAIAEQQLARLVVEKAAGRLDVQDYTITAGDVVSAPWWGPGARGMRVMQTELTAKGNALGCERPVSTASLLTFLQQRVARQPFGVLRWLDGVPSYRP